MRHGQLATGRSRQNFRVIEFAERDERDILVTGWSEHALSVAPRGAGLVSANGSDGSVKYLRHDEQVVGRTALFLAGCR
jgi:hypothetical protein